MRARLAEFLDESSILMDFSAPDKWEAIRRMTRALVSAGRLSSAHEAAAIEALIARETIATTGIENGIALPHAKVNGIEHPLAVFAVSSSGVPFQSQDGQPARLILLLLIPLKSAHLHLRTLAEAARLLNFEEIRRMILAARTPRDVLQIIREEEQKQLV